ncbi:MAG: beta-lactamase family protein [Rubrivivax sp.]|nr:beta-lactamase family protein [Rubrivivax sp.]
MCTKSLCSRGPGPWLFFSLFLFSTASFADEPFSQRFKALLAQHELPGAVVLIKRGDSTLHHQAYGKVNLKKPADMQKDAIFRIYSMSKPITAFALLQLVDQGKVALGDDIRKYLPELAPFEVDGTQQVITIHQLLSHTAGLGYGGGFRNWIDIRYLLANPLSRRNSLRDMVDDVSGIELKFVPGKRFGYSLASDIQGAIIEAVARVPLDRYLQQHVFDPLQMKDTGFHVPRNAQHRLVDMYEFDTDSIDEALVFNKKKIAFAEAAARSPFLKKPAFLSGGGGLVSTAADFSNFTSMLRNKGQFGGKTLLSSALVDSMLTSQTRGLDMSFLPKVYPGAGFGYGIGVMEAPGGIRHPGSFFWAGMGGTLFWVDPVADVQVIVMMQVEDGWVALDRWMSTEVHELLARHGRPRAAAQASEVRQRMPAQSRLP